MRLSIHKPENEFQRKILRKFPEFTADDFHYFTTSIEDKVKKLGLPHKGCKINKVFIGANEADYHRRHYCLNNCGFKCLGFIKVF